MIMVFIYHNDNLKYVGLTINLLPKYCNKFFVESTIYLINMIMDFIYHNDNIKYVGLIINLLPKL